MNSLRREIFERDEWTCQYCGVVDPDEGLHLEHVIPVSKGGPDEHWNLVAACRTCNLRKSAKLLPTEACPLPFRLGRWGYTPTYAFWDLCKRYRGLIDGLEYIQARAQSDETKRWSAWSEVKRVLKPSFDSCEDFDRAMRNLSVWVSDNTEDLNDYELSEGIEEIAA